MGYTDKSFKDCLFNPLTDNLFAAYPELEAFAEPFKDNHSIRKLRYIILLYDPQSPLIKKTANIQARKMEALTVAGFDQEKEIKACNEMMDFADPGFTLMVNGYFARFIAHRTWTMICTMEQVWWEYNAMMLEKVFGDNSKQKLDAIEKKAKLRVEMEALDTLLSRKWEEFYGSTDNKDLMEASKAMHMTPERIKSLLG